MTKTHHGTLWTPRQLARFRHLWTQTVVPGAQIAEEMGRTKAACNAQAQTMVIKRPTNSEKDRQRKEPIGIFNQERYTAERQAEKIRAYWVSVGHPKTVNVVYVPLGTDKKGAWSAVIVEPIEFLAPAVPKQNR